MDDSRYGTLLAIVGAIQALLAVVMGIVPELLSASYMARVQTVYSTNAFWIAIGSGGLLLVHIGRSVQHGLVTFTGEEQTRRRFYLTSAALVVFGFVISLVFFAFPGVEG